MSERAAAPDPVLDVEEVRVAMALNGGVSLAVWMGGGAVEIDCARRAHLGEEPIEGAPTRRVYRAICAAFGRRLVVDVMSGSSAGGINGALLAAATVGRRRLHPDYLRERWIELGDLGKLLHKLTNDDPYSLMDGQYFYEELLATFRAVRWEGERDPDDDPEPRNAPPDEPEPLVPPPALDITTTDVAGADRVFADVWGGRLSALEYRARFRFREEEHYAATTLAVAARSSASFPLAFEPFVVDDPAARALAGFGDAPRAVIDGGLLDNAPIAAAIELVKARPANLLVRRYLCYVNGEPKDVTKLDEPPADESDEQKAARLDKAMRPRLPRVVGNVLGLPRKAPFADQLKALDDAAWRGMPTRLAELRLLALESGTLGATADHLLDAYRARRRLVSLRELLPDDPAMALAMADELSRSDAELPWLPTGMEPPPAGTWPWGVQAARRIHHLAIDTMRPRLGSGSQEDRRRLLAARMAIDEQIQALDAHRTSVSDDPEVRRLLVEMGEGRAGAQETMTALAARMPAQGELRDGVVATAEALLGVADLLVDYEGVALAPALFGDRQADELTPAMLDCFLRRVLGIEVMRRAFSMERDVDDGQRLGFAQLTPLAPTPLFDERPVSAPCQRSPENKLTGIRLAHFSAFHRRSWRANDFMWGRLDGAARVVAMLVEPARAETLKADEPWSTLAKALLPPDEAAGPAFAETLRWLASEALDDEGAPPHADLEVRLARALQHDLVAKPPAERGTFTRIACTRAAQLEILVHELPVLVREASGDVLEGASSGPLDLPDPGEAPADAVRAIRTQAPLAEQLGRDETAEIVSDLALRTASRGGLVSLALLRRSTLPLMGPLQVLRALFLSLAGAVARNRVYRGAALAAFAAAFLLLTARAYSVDADSSDLEQLSKQGLLLSLICLLVVVGVTAVPFLRAVGRKGADRIVHGAFVAIAVAAAFFGVWLPSVRGAPSWADAVVAAGFEPPDLVAWAPVALVMGYSVAALPIIGRRLPKVFLKPWTAIVGSVLVFAGAGAIGWWSLDRVRDATDAAWWIAPLAAVAAAGAYLFLLPEIVKRARRLTARP